MLRDTKSGADLFGLVESAVVPLGFGPLGAGAKELMRTWIATWQDLRAMSERDKDTAFSKVVDAVRDLIGAAAPIRKGPGLAILKSRDGIVDFLRAGNIVEVTAHTVRSAMGSIASRVALRHLVRAAAPQFMVDLRNTKPINMPPQDRGAVNRDVHKILEPIYFRDIPLGDLFSALERRGYYPIQEDGTPWSGLLVGRDGQARLDLAVRVDEAVWAPVKNALLILTWHKMDSGRYEVGGYIS